MSNFKIYYAFMDEISSSDIYTGLLGQGLFSEKLPPIFTSKEFCNFCLRNQHPFFPKKEFGYVFFENMRNINVPRPLGIPNPVAYHNLCEVISGNWSKLQSYFRSQTENQSYKISRIHIRKRLGSSKLFEMNYNNWKIDGSPEPSLLIGMRYMVGADISNCFPSIYSHSLSWALVGKDVAKNNRNHGEWYNELDRYTRNLKCGETHGLLIGPHASNLLSEIILTNVDKTLYDKGFRFIRNIDDYTCYTQSYEKAQRFLVELSANLRLFDLTLNHKKTRISELPIASTEQWVRKINTFSSFDMKDKMDYKDVQAYIDLALDLMAQNSENAAILKYAIKVLANKKLTNNAKQYLVKTVLHLCIIYPYIIPMLEEYIFITYGVNSDTIKHISQLIYKEGMCVQNYEAVSFSIYFAIKYNFPLDISFDEMKKSNNAVCLLMAYLYAVKTKRKSDIKLYKDYAKELADNEDSFDSFWVFIYECLPKSSLKDYWKKLKNNGITFVNI